MKSRKTVLIVAIIGAILGMGIGYLAGMRGKDLVGLALLGAMFSIAESAFQTMCMNVVLPKSTVNEEDEVEQASSGLAEDEKE